MYSTSQIEWDLDLRERFTEMVKNGAMYVEISKEFGINECTIWKWKRRLGLPMNYNVGNRSQRHYTIYRAKDDSIVCFGSARECAKALDMSMSTFRSMVSRTIHGHSHKYEILIEPASEDEE